MFGLIMDLAGMLNQLSLNTLIFQLIDHCQEVLEIPVEVRSPRKGLINIKNKDQKCFLWCHVRHINSLKEHPERIKITNKKVAEKLDYDKIEFPIQEKDFSKIKVRNKSLVTKMDWFFRFLFWIKNLKTQWICCF